MASCVYLFSIIQIISFLLRLCSLIDVPHGSFTGIGLPNGRSQINFYGIPLNSGFAVLQLHTPFNRILVSTTLNFDYWSSQSCSHCGLSPRLSNTLGNVTLYIYSMHDTFISAWARVDGYPSEYPWPGGCSSSLHGPADATLTYDVAKLPTHGASSMGTFTNLRYWTSTLSFTLAVPPVASRQLFRCNNSLIPQPDIVYHIYVRPLVIAGSLHETSSNPSPAQAAEVLHSLSSVDSVDAAGYHKLQMKASSVSERFVAEFPVARNPGQAAVVLVVVEYQNEGSSLRVAYSPSILYGCPPEQQSTSTGNLLRRGYIAVHNVSQQLNCSLLPEQSPALYFLVAVVLLVSLLYACACHCWIWPRCAVALMVISSLFGSLLCFRYNTAYHDAVLILVVAAVFPGLLAVLLFTVIWCTCIRPTLYYRRAFGRGPLIRVPVHDTASGYQRQAADSSTATDGEHQPLLPLEDELENSVSFHLPDSRLFYPDTDNGGQPAADDYILGTGELWSPSIQTPVHPENATVAGGDGATASCRTSHTRRRRRWWCWSGKGKRSNQLFSLRPRRIARLPPILPAAFIIVAYLTYLFDETFLLTNSIAAYLAFVICISILILALFCVFKNFAFGLGTALLGFYLSLSCACLFLVPNSLFPHILIEQFLRLAWVEYRLSVLQLHSFGLYDIIVQAAWLVASFAMGLITLCTIRLKDARELSVATRTQLQSDIPIVSQQILATSGGDAAVGMSGSASGGGLCFWERGTPAVFPSLSQMAGGAAAGVDSVSLSMADSTATNLNVGTVGRPVGGELQPLLANLYRRSNYGGFSTGLPLSTTTGPNVSSLASNSQSLVPLSRVQLMTGRMRHTDSFSRLSPAP